ncbi:hypothetical protein ACKAV7_012045 [Fusarium commune]
MTSSKLFSNGRIMTKADATCDGPVPFADSMLVQDGKITAVGSSAGIADGIHDVQVYDLRQRVVLPSFIDGHMHLLLLGQSLHPRPIFIDSSDLHSCWCSSAALEVLDLDDMPDPVGGRIYRDAAGKPSGLLDEGAMMSIIWPYQARSSPKQERIAAIRTAIREYNAAGYTGLVEMAMDEEAWDALVTFMEDPGETIRIAA